MLLLLLLLLLLVVVVVAAAAAAAAAVVVVVVVFKRRTNIGKVMLAFASVDKNLKYAHSKKSNWAVLPFCTVCYAVDRKSSNTVYTHIQVTAIE